MYLKVLLWSKIYSDILKYLQIKIFLIKREELDHIKVNCR